MLHHNHAPHPLTFTLRGVTYSVAAGEEIDIPARVAYAVPASLRPVPGAVREEPEEETIEVWKRRALAERERADRLGSAVERAEQGERDAAETLAQEREARDGFVAQLREALSIAPAESIFTAIKALRDAAEEAATAPAAAPPKPGAAPGKGGR